MIAEHRPPIKFKREGFSCDNYMESAVDRIYARFSCVVVFR